MPDYKQDPNDSTKQVPGDLTDRHFDRASNVQTCSLQKSPHYILVNSTLTDSVGFYFGPSSASFASKITAEGTDSVTQAQLTGSQHYIKMLEDAAAGTTLHISPNAWSGSEADAGKITFVYRGSLDGMGRP